MSNCTKKKKINIKIERIRKIKMIKINGKNKKYEWLEKWNNFKIQCYTYKNIRKIIKVKYSRYVQCQQKYFPLISIIWCRPVVIKKKWLKK